MSPEDDWRIGWKVIIETTTLMRALRKINADNDSFYKLWTLIDVHRVYFSP